MNTNMKPLTLVAAVLVSACASVPTYVEPSAGQLARVRFRAEIETVEVFHREFGTDCRGADKLIGLLSQRKSGTGISTLGMPSFRGGTSSTTTEKRVAAGKPLQLSFTGSSSLWVIASICEKLPFGFTPEAGKDYEVTFFHEPKLCVVRVDEIRESNPERYLRLPVRMLPAGESNSCK